MGVIFSIVITVIGFVTLVFWLFEFFDERAKDFKPSGFKKYLGWIGLAIFSIGLISSTVAFHIDAKNSESYETESNKDNVDTNESDSIDEDQDDDSGSKDETDTSSGNQIDELDDWYKNDFRDQATSDHDSGDMDDDSFKKINVIKGFETQGDNLYVKVSLNQMEAENFSQKEIAQYAFNAIVTQYDGDTSEFDNFENGSIKPDEVKNMKNYVEFVD